MMRKRLQKMSFMAALLALAFAMVTVSCPDPTDGGGGGGGTVVNGSWESADGKKLIFSGSSFTRIPGSSTLDYKGTFSLSDDGKINFTITQYSSDGGNKWLTYNQYIDARIIALAGISEATWNSYPSAQKQQLRDTWSSIITKPSTTDSGTYELLLDGKQLKIIYAGAGTEASRTVVYQKAGTSTVANALVGKWVIEGAPTVVVLDFSTSQLKLRRSTTTYTYYTLETSGKIEIGTDPGVFTQDFCDSYTITGDTLTFTGGSSADWYPSITFKKYVFPPFTPTPLTADQWKDGAITSSTGEAWYSFNVTNGTTYRLWWNDSYSSTTGDGTKTLDVKVSGYYDADTSIFTDADSAWGSARSFTANKSGTVYVKVTPYFTTSGTGTFGIIYSSTATTRPGIVFNPPANAVPLTANQWKDGAITSSDGEAWYSFSVTSGNPFYVWWNDSYLSTTGNRIKTLDVRVTAFYANGTLVTNFTNVDTAWSTAQTINSATDATVYLRVAPKNAGNTGTYGIVYSASNTRPEATITIPSTIPSATPLTDNQWANGAITTAGGEAWYSFTVTNGTTYRLWGDGSGNGLFKTLANMRVSAWYDNGTNIFYEQSSPWSSAQTINAASSGTVYVRVYSGASGNTGTFGLAYSSTATVRPTVPFDTNAMTNLSALTAGVWKDGEITSTSGSSVWYSIPVTNGTYYLWWNERTTGSTSYGDGTKTLNISVSAYSSDGTVQFTDADSAWGTVRSFTVLSNDTVYVRVYSYTSGNTGTYGIVYNTSNTRPALTFAPPNPTTLTAGQWANGSITTGTGQQWFKFTATATDQYIHFNYNFGTLNDVYVTVYDSTGTLQGGSTGSNLYSSTTNTSRTLVVDQEYYMRVWPYSSSGNGGTYQIAFNTSTTSP